MGSGGGPSGDGPGADQHLKISLTNEAIPLKEPKKRNNSSSKKSKKTAHARNKTADYDEVMNLMDQINKFNVDA